jgi:hypothetical protein
MVEWASVLVGRRDEVAALELTLVEVGRGASRLDDSLAAQTLQAEVEATDARGARQLERDAGTVRVVVHYATVGRHRADACGRTLVWRLGLSRS